MAVKGAIRRVLTEDRVPALLAKAEEKAAEKGQTKEGLKQRGKADRLAEDLRALPEVAKFTYEDSEFSNYRKGELGHTDVIEIASYLLRTNAIFRRITALRFPYIFVDEAQDTFKSIVEGLNLVCAGEGLPIVGYFGDPWQQIYDDRAGDFGPPEGGSVITKTENFRSSATVIAFLNAFRDDVEQYPAGDNKDRPGSVSVRLIRAEKPEEPRSTYSQAQVNRALERMESALREWGWNDREDVMRLLLARQMIARRLGFGPLNDLFNNDKMASGRAKDAYEDGSHFLLAPFLSTICPLLRARESGESHRVIEVLRRESPAFAVDGENAMRSLRYMLQASQTAIDELHRRWSEDTVGGILRHCASTRLIRVSEKLREHLARKPRQEAYDEALHAQEKGDWLADAFFAMKPETLLPYAKFIQDNSAFSTQHGVKGEAFAVGAVFGGLEIGQDRPDRLAHPADRGGLVEPVERGGFTDQNPHGFRDLWSDGERERGRQDRARSVARVHMILRPVVEEAKGVNVASEGRRLAAWLVVADHVTREPVQPFIMVVALVLARAAFYAAGGAVVRPVLEADMAALASRAWPRRVRDPFSPRRSVHRSSSCGLAGCHRPGRLQTVVTRQKVALPTPSEAAARYVRRRGQPFRQQTSS